jgi:hypothetical protein
MLCAVWRGWWTDGWRAAPASIVAAAPARAQAWAPAQGAPRSKRRPAAAAAAAAASVRSQPPWSQPAGGRAAAALGSAGRGARAGQQHGAAPAPTPLAAGLRRLPRRAEGLIGWRVLLLQPPRRRPRGPGRSGAAAGVAAEGPAAAEAAGGGAEVGFVTEVGPLHRAHGW